MRNDDNEHEKYPFLGIKHEKRMRNAYIRKHFSFPISVYFNPLTNNHENMRNEFKIRLVLRQIPCFFIFKYALFIFYYLVINQYTL